MKTYGVVRLDDVNSIYTGHIHSVVYDEDILQNGMVGVLGSLKEKDDGTFEREIRNFEQPEDTAKPVVLIAHPEIQYAQYSLADNSLQNFYIPKGMPARAYSLEQYDMFSVSDNMVSALNEDTGVKVGNYVTTEAGSFKMTEIAEAGDQAFLGRIIGKEKLGTSTYVGGAGVVSRVIEFVVIEVLRNRY